MEVERGGGGGGDGEASFHNKEKSDQPTVTTRGCYSPATILHMPVSHSGDNSPEG